MTKDFSEYIYLDGMWLQEKQLLKLAMNVGSFQLAEHYLCALLFDAVLKGRRETVYEVNKVRVHYGVCPIPLSEDDMENEKELNGQTKVSAADEHAKKVFMNLPKEKKIEILRMSMSLLLSDYHLFIYARHWWSIFMVIRDRLVGESLSQVNFVGLANEFSPEELPMDLRMSLSTMKNFSREINAEDRGEVYYKMKRNPQQKLCDTFWDIVKMTILTKKKPNSSRNDERFDD